MLIFLFAALVVVVDQLFKRWIVLTVRIDGPMELIPSVIGLRYAENTGAAFGIFSNMRWPLVGVTLALIVVLIIIIRRYNGGFWGSLSLAAILGGGVGNLIDRVFQGYVVDMFELYFINFPIFNVADIFITLGAIVFIVHFITTSVKHDREIKREAVSDNVVEFDQYREYTEDDLEDIMSDTQPLPNTEEPEEPIDPMLEFTAPDPIEAAPYESITFDPSTLDYDTSGIEKLNIDGLTETSILEDYDLDELMKEYGFDNDDEND